MENEFDKKTSKLLRTDEFGEVLGISRHSMHHTVGGVTSLISHIAWIDNIPEEELEAIPDYVLSDTLSKDLDTSVMVCALNLKKTKYFPDKIKISSRYGWIPEGGREGVLLENWEDFDVVDCIGEPLYTSEILQEVRDDFKEPLAFVLFKIVKDICDDGGFISEDWYSARILYEYFREYPVPPNNAYLVGELFKELCSKGQFEVDLISYYARLADEKDRRRKGTEATQRKATELRQFCVQAFIDLAEELGPRFLMAPYEVQAAELRDRVIKERPQEYQRGGKPYRNEWFLRHIVEDMRLEIIERLNQRKRL